MRADLAQRAWASICLQSVVDHLADMVFRCDGDGRILYANNAYLDFHGVSGDAVRGRSFIELSPPDERDRLLGVLAQIQALTPTRDSRRGEAETRGADGSPLFHVWTDQAFFDDEGTMLGFTSVGRDVTVVKLREARNSFRLIHDSLTGLRNRRGAQRHLDQVLRGPGEPDLAVLYLDLNGFKAINDTHGHAAGDSALIECGEAMRRTVGPRDLVCRIGGDEFVVIVGGPGAELAARGASRRIRDAIGTLRQPLGAGIGIAVAQPGDTAESLLERADQAMYRDKRNPRR